MDVASNTPNFSADKYSAMTVWELYSVMSTMVSIMNTFDLTCRSASDGESAVFGWAEEHEKRLDKELQAMSGNLAARLGLSRDDEDVRDMAFARVDGLVPSFIWADGRANRMRTATELRKAGA